MNSRFFALGISSFVFVIAMLGYFLIPKQYSPSILLFILIAALALVGVFLLHREEYPWLKGQSIKCSNIFLLGYIIVHFQCYVDVLMGNISADDSFLMVRPDLILKSAFLALLGLSAFSCGYFCTQGKPMPSFKKQAVVSLIPLLLFTTIMLPVWIFSVGGEYFAGGYGRDVDVGAFSSYASLIFEMSLWAIPLLHARNFRIKGERPSFIRFILSLGWYNALLIVFLMLVMTSGDRGPIISTILFVFVSFLYASGLKVSKTKFVAFVFVAAFSLTLLGFARNFGQGVNFREKIMMAWQAERINESISPNTLELAGSVRCTHHAINNVPSSHGFMFGRFQLSNICAVVPTGNRWMMLLGVLPPETRYMSSAHFVTWLIQGDRPTYGDGVNCVADFYLDLGWGGVAIGMLIFGFWVRRFDVNLYIPSPISLLLLAFVFVFTVKAIYIPRSSILLELKSAVWLFIILYVYERLFGQASFSSHKS